jgi:hypothetical protein
LGAVKKRRVFPLLLGIVAFVLAGASVQHLHTGTGPGLWNYDHDLSLMAAVGTYASQPHAMPALDLVADPAAVFAPPVADHSAASLRPSAPRAPPLA